VKAVRALPASLLLVMLGCGNPSAPAPALAPTAAKAVDFAAEGLSALQKREMARAADLLRQALVADPTNVTLHYSLAVAASHLDQRDEAVKHFQWVLANAPARSAEAMAARTWLTEAGVFKEATSRAENAVDETAGNSGVRGEIAWTGGPSPVPTARLQLFLKGLPNTSTAGLQYVLRTDQDGRFEFKRIPAGTYKLTNRLAGAPLWRLRVQVPPGERVTFDLTSANSVNVRDDFPEDS
jgi:tetratricopeptide (TPR) repeat protein